ncbi:hypothetical protein [Mycobacterium aquaticum]|nr:hypothetical protein [Mycobacterium aquaticum]
MHALGLNPKLVIARIPAPILGSHRRRVGGKLLITGNPGVVGLTF